MSTLDHIKSLAQRHADARALLSERVAAYKDEQEALLRRRQRGIQNAINAAAETEAELRAAVEAAPEVFAKPRSHVFGGIKFGFQKGKPSLEIADPDRTVDLIERHYTSRADELVRTVKKPNAKVLIDEPAKLLSRVGIKYVDGKDQVIVRPIDSDLDKLVDALLGNALDELDEETAAA